MVGFRSVSSLGGMIRGMVLVEGRSVVFYAFSVSAFPLVFAHGSSQGGLSFFAVLDWYCYMLRYAKY